jgi:hypothetical protein
MVTLAPLLAGCGGAVPTTPSPPAVATVPVTEPAGAPTGVPTTTSPVPASTPLETAPPETPKEVRGMILEVTARGLTEVERLRLRDAQGREWSFTTQGYVGITPSHLREHQAFGQSVLVSYLERDGQLVALDVLD